MDIEQLAPPPPPPVDEDAITAEVIAYLDGRDAPAGAGNEWRITNVAQADWAMARVAELRRIERDYDDQIKLWQDARGRAAGSVQFFTDRLMEWAAGERTDKRKTFPLAHGTVATRETPSKLCVVDEDAAISWCAKHAPDALKITTEVLVSRVPLKVGEVIVGFRSVHRSTGAEEVLHIEPVRSDVNAVAVVAAKMGDDYTVEALVEQAVVNEEGHPVNAGFGVRAGRVSATVTPLML